MYQLIVVTQDGIEEKQIEWRWTMPLLNMAKKLGLMAWVNKTSSNGTLLSSYDISTAGRLNKTDYETLEG